MQMYDLVIVAESLDELKEKLKLWKDELELKGLKVNVGKTKLTRFPKVCEEIKVSLWGM